METEIWPNMIEAVHNSDATLVYTNVRLSERSYLGYAKFPKLVQRTLSMVDVSVPQSLRESAEVMRRQLGQDRLIWIAGSTREGEEGRILSAYKNLKQQFPSLLLLLVPRHPERFDYMARKIQRRGLACVRRTENIAELNADIDVFLGDTMGELSVAKIF